MKKFGKFIFGSVVLASIAAGAYYIYKNLIRKDSSDDFEDFEDDFEDFDSDDEETDDDSREYVSINIDDKESSAQEAGSGSADDDKEILPEDEQ